MKLTSRRRLSSQVHTAIRVTGCAAAACVVVAAANLAYAGAGLVPHKAISLPAGVSSFDISFVDPATHTYILGDRTNNGVDVIDTKTNTLRMIAGQGLFRGVVAVCAVANSCSGPNGVLIVGGTTDSNGNITGGEIWAGDAGAGLTSGPGCTAPSQCSSVKVLSLVTGALIQNINTGGQFRADEMCFDPVDNVVMATNNADTPPFANIIDAGSVGQANKKIVAQIPWNNNTNGAEQCVYNPRTGLLYETAPELNGPGDNSQPGGVAVVDPKIAIAQNFSGTPGPGQGNDVPVVATYVLPLTACDGPQGMAIGPAPQMLVGCNGGPASAQSSDASVVINDGSTGLGVPGSVIAELPNQDGPDEVDYNPSSRLYTLAKSTKTVTNLVGNIGMVSATTFVADVNIPTAATSGGAHSVASNFASRSTYVPIPIASAASKLCSSVGGVDSQGCILQLTRSITNTHDFDANTASDILFRDASGSVGMWLMSLNTGGFQQQTGKLTLKSTTTLGNVSSSWSIVGQRDFAGNGFNSILWRDTSGNLAAWQMNGSTIVNTTTYSPLPNTTSVVGTGQFNANGMGDILVQDVNGNLSVVFMNGASILAVKPIGAVPAGWTVAGSDNKGAIFLRNGTTGDVGVWLIGCTTFEVSLNSTSCSPVNSIDLGPVPLSWQIAGIGDFDGNGSSDILWKDTSNNVGIWLMEINDQAIKIQSTTVLGTVPSGWNVALTGDFNGVGKASILWADTVGDIGAWAMNGAAISAVVNFGNIGTSWSVQGLNAE